jgi:hypothetical protein
MQALIVVCDASLIIDHMFYYRGDVGIIKAAAPGIFRRWGKPVADGTADRWRRGEAFRIGSPVGWMAGGMRRPMRGGRSGYGVSAGGRWRTSRGRPLQRGEAFPMG